MGIAKQSAALLLAALTIPFMLSGCDRGKTDTPGKAPETSVRTVAIITLVAHPALDLLQNNVRKELESQGFGEANGIRFEVRNASGQMQLLSTIASEIAAKNPAVTIAITTPVSQAIVKAVRGPIVFSAVTDPVGAGIVASLDSVRDDLTGVTDSWPYEEQIKLINEITPKVKRLGVIHNPAESASQFGMREIRKFGPRYGLEIIEGTVTSTSDVISVSESLAGKVDALLLSSDSTAIGGVAGALRTAVRHRIPLYVGDGGTVSQGGLAAVSNGYGRMGTQTGALAVRILRGEKNIPIVNPIGIDVFVNLEAARLMGVTVPPAVLARATVTNKIAE